MSLEQLHSVRLGHESQLISRAVGSPVVRSIATKYTWAGVPKCSLHAGFRFTSSRLLTAAWRCWQAGAITISAIDWLQCMVDTHALTSICNASSSLPGFERLRQTYAEHDVSATDIDAAAGGAYGTDPAELLRMDPEAAWVTTTYNPGDVLLFGMKTMHGQKLGAVSHRSQARAETPLMCALSQVRSLVNASLPRPFAFLPTRDGSRRARPSTTGTPWG